MKTGSSTATGVIAPVRPTLTRISRTRVLFSSGGYLKAIAQRGLRAVLPRRSCRARSFTLITIPSIS